MSCNNDSLSYEDPNFAAFPTYPVALPLKGESEDVNIFKDRVNMRAIPGLPEFDPNRVVRLFHFSH